MQDIQAMLDAARTKADGTVLSTDRLSEVFDLVKPEPTWKYPINAVVPSSLADAEEIRMAVEWFCGGSPDVREGQGGCLIVTGAGYYEWIDS